MKKRRLLIGLFTTLLLVCMLPLTVFADESDKDVENNEFTVTVETGLDGIAVEDQSMPVSVTVANSGKDFTGVLRIVIPSTYAKESIAYEKKVTIPSGGEKSTSMLLPDVTKAAFLRIELENDKGKILYSQQFPFTSFEVGRMAVIGILSDDYTGLNYFDGLNVSTPSGAIETKILRLTKDNIPDTGEGLSSCHYILIDNYNTSQLSQEQRGAIASWVSNGGILILGTGSKASVVLEGFQDTIGPISVNGLSKQDVMVANSMTGETKSVDVASLSVEGWQDISGWIAPGGGAYQSSYGNGMVLVLGYDLAMEPLVSWREQRSQLAENILENAGNDKTYANMMYGYSNEYDSYDMNNAVEGVDRNKLPNPLLYALVFLVYVIGIGPVSYSILKKKDKREKMWIVMPIIAFGFTIVVFITSMLYRIHKPFIDAVSIVNFNNGNVHTETYMSLQSPKGREYILPFAEGWRTVETWGNYYGYSSQGQTDYTCAILEEGNQTQLRIKQKTAFESHALMIRRDEYQGNKGFDLDLDIDLQGFDGQVTNRTGYDLTNVVVCHGEYYAFVGDLKDGDTARITRKQNEMIYSVYYYNVERYWMEKEPNDFFFLTEENRTLKDNRNMYRILLDQAEELEIGQGMVFGMIRDYKVDLLDDNSANVYSAGVALHSFYQIPSDYYNFTVFINNINDYMVGGDSKITYDTNVYPEGFDYFYDAEDAYVYEEMEVLYDFGNLDLTGAQLLLGGNNNADQYSWELLSKVELYNYGTQTYENPFTEDGILYDVSPYVNDWGWMQIKYLPGDEIDGYIYTTYYAPQITLIGGEK